MSQNFYYKLSKTASVYFDPKSRMKVTSKVPSRTNVKTLGIKNATKSGHIIEISKAEYDKLIALLPKATQVTSEKEQSAHAPVVKAKAAVKEEVEEEEEVAVEEEEVEEEEEVASDDGDRTELLRQLKEVTNKKNYNIMKDKSNAEIKKFLED